MSSALTTYTESPVSTLMCRSSSAGSVIWRVERILNGPVGAGNSAVVVDLPRCGPMLSPRVPNLVPIPGPRMERETPGQRPRPNNGHPQPRKLASVGTKSALAARTVASLPPLDSGSAGTHVATVIP